MCVLHNSWPPWKWKKKKEKEAGFSMLSQTRGWGRSSGLGLLVQKAAPEAWPREGQKRVLEDRRLLWTLQKPIPLTLLRHPWTTYYIQKGDDWHGWCSEEDQGTVWPIIPTLRTSLGRDSKSMKDLEQFVGQQPNCVHSPIKVAQGTYPLSLMLKIDSVLWCDVDF